MSRRQSRQRIHIGTSGWHYDHWVGPFYPEGTRPTGMLAHYVRHFRTVEINNTFYRLPAEKTLVHWRDHSPHGFLFACKASRYITHMKKLKDPRESLALFLGRIQILGPKLGPILFQLPPRWRLNPKRLASFLKALPRNWKYAFEFRDESWFDSRVYEILEEYGAAFCIYHLAGLSSPHEVTAEFVYMRLHGPNGPYQGRYGSKVADWARPISSWLRQQKEVYCYFDNDQCAYAIQDALRLRAIVGQQR